MSDLSKMERLDKILANAKIGSRKEVRLLIKDGRIRVDDEIAKDHGARYDREQNKFYLDGALVDTREFIYLILNKPEGYLSATEDAYGPVVIDLLQLKHQAFDPFPVGRLDKDTKGLLLLTNDGVLNHKLISPRWHINKVYRAKLRDPAEENYHKKLLKGIVLDDDYRCLPALMEVLSEDGTEVELTIQEGKFHQVKRMFEALGNKVLDLTRIGFGPLDLPKDLALGEYRELRDEELELLRQAVKKKAEPLKIDEEENKLNTK